jgi:hypothetical protein
MLRIAHAADKQACDFAGHESDGQAREDRVGEDDARAAANGFGETEFDEIDKDDRIVHDDAGAGHEGDPPGAEWLPW